jgi:hypothetical protein
MGLAPGMIWGRSARFYLTWLWSRLTVSASTITKVGVSISSLRPIEERNL